jgi:hypothetical protein
MSFKQDHSKVPVITLGRYAGTPIDQLPHSYLRWMVTQDFPRAWLECAKKKLDASDYGDTYLNVSRHAIDMFSKRFLAVWAQQAIENADDAVGLATFIATMAQEAWEKGEDVSKHRHQDDGTIKLYQGIKWVFHINTNFPDYKDVITVMSGEDSSTVINS